MAALSPPVISAEDNALSQGVDTNIHNTIPEGNQPPDLDDTAIQQQLDNMFNAGPVNPKAVEFGAKEVEVGGRKLRMPSTSVTEADFGSFTVHVPPSRNTVSTNFPCRNTIAESFGSVIVRLPLLCPMRWVL